MKRKTKTMSLKQSIKNINFDIMVHDICDPSIIYNKLVGLYKHVKEYIIGCSLLFNTLVQSDTLADFRSFIEKYKKEMNIYKDAVSNFEKTLFMPGTPGYDILTNNVCVTYKLFSESSLIEMMTYTYRILVPKIKLDDPSWITNSVSMCHPFLNVDIDVFVLYNINKTSTIKYINSIFEASKKFYDIYVLPNFDMNNSIDSISEYLMKLHRTQQVSCDLIPVYMRMVYEKGLYDIKELNLAYLETENKNVFVTNLIETMLHTETDDLKPNADTSRQIRGLISYFKKKNNDPKIAATLAAGKSILNMTK